ncbi:hypothetical protein [Cohnella thailandensis]|jgi:hypothetical protein|uniref:Uncharacterized protein n=1 Tax=Cohnella thailandensis TaxID=557557 RepID=A0A841T9I2_9BACL|nr:hypothetical protein [Cohnella thailandensis]MBB6637871.1 hypothetical protein [Cohnella thailandensis]MBP1977421.1 hypothetical protein [Cohnella thailandensis]
MSVRYELRCFECDVLVRQEEDAYQLSIQARSNPLGRGNQLAIYDTESQAKDAADRFCQMYTLAREYGYFLHGSEFRREECSSISVPEHLSDGTTLEQFRSLLEEESRNRDLPLPN